MYGLCTYYRRYRRRISAISPTLTFFLKTTHQISTRRHVHARATRAPLTLPPTSTLHPRPGLPPSARCISFVREHRPVRPGNALPRLLHLHQTTVVVVRGRQKRRQQRSGRVEGAGERFPSMMAVPPLQARPDPRQPAGVEASTGREPVEEAEHCAAVRLDCQAVPKQRGPVLAPHSSCEGGSGGRVLLELGELVLVPPYREENVVGGPVDKAPV